MGEWKKWQTEPEHLADFQDLKKEKKDIESDMHNMELELKEKMSLCQESTIRAAEAAKLLLSVEESIQLSKEQINRLEENTGCEANEVRKLRAHLKSINDNLSCDEAALSQMRTRIAQEVKRYLLKAPNIEVMQHVLSSFHLALVEEQVHASNSAYMVEYDRLERAHVLKERVKSQSAAVDAIYLLESHELETPFLTKHKDCFHEIHYELRPAEKGGSPVFAKGNKPPEPMEAFDSIHVLLGGRRRQPHQEPSFEFADEEPETTKPKDVAEAPAPEPTNPRHAAAALGILHTLQSSASKRAEAREANMNRLYEMDRQVKYIQASPSSGYDVLKHDPLDT